MDTEKKTSWLERVEEIVTVLEGSTVGEFALTEAGTEITIRRRPGMVMTNAPTQIMLAGQTAAAPTAKTGRGAIADKSVAIPTPLTGVYYAAPSPTTPPFVTIGDLVQIGQVVALIEAMKVFNEITAEVTGRVVSIVATSGAVIQKGEALLRIEPM